jgi:spore coat polysaccharide biosynthesis predicted glycosyltransferase SpsG/GNAT superfamily N-acetyltransferase
MRALALAQVWQDETGGEVHLAVAAPLPPTLAERVRREGVAIDALAGTLAPGSADDVAALLEAARALETEVVVVDHYDFDAVASSALCEAGLRVLCFDDHAHRDRLAATWLVNPNLHARADLYPAMPRQQLLLGVRYAPLRREFLRRPRPQSRAAVPARRIGVSLGGSDPRGLTRPVVEGVAGLRRDDVEISVVVGGGAARARALADGLRSVAPGITIVRNVDDMAAWMEQQDVAISAGGTTTHELMYFGIPSLVVGVADNQVAAIAAMDAAGVAESLGWFADLTATRITERLGALLDDPVRCARMATRCRGLQDGRGAERLVAALRFDLPLVLRRVEAEDSRALWEWANDPETRSWSFDTAPIPWPRHVDWMAGKLADEGCAFFVGEVGDERVGCVRFDRPEAGAEPLVVSVTVAPAWRGRGVGRALIDMGTARVLRQTPQRSIRAYIRCGNSASVRAFQAARYRPCGKEVIRGVAAWRYEFTAPE